jgi:oligogalacturonide transport system permease protein
LNQVKNKIKTSAIYCFLIAFSIVFLYPLIWLLFSSFKTNTEIFSSPSLWPQQFLWSSYALGWKGVQYSFGTFMANTFSMTLPTVLFTLISSSFVAYGFARFDFPLKNIFFTIMIATLMLPNTVLTIPRYTLFRRFNWIDTYLPIIVPVIFACAPFFIFMLLQFFRGIPKELGESAMIDGCNSFNILFRIYLPLSKASLFALVAFQFLWTWNDFYNVLIYLNSVSKYTVSLGLRMMLDIEAATSWNQILAMSVVSLVPCIIVFFMAQKYLVEGIATTGLKS